MEKEYKISWGKVFGVTLVVVILIAIIWFLVPKNKNKGVSSNNTYINNINLMKNAGFEYFQGSNLPTKIGEAYEISLEEMINSKLIMEFTDDHGKACDTKESYVKTTKTLDNEYAMKVYLSCDDKTDYIVTSIADNIAYINLDNTDNKENDEENITSKSYDEGYYDKNGNYIDTSNSYSDTKDYYYNTNNSSSNVTNYYINYVYTCKSGNCNNNCSCPNCNCTGSCVGKNCGTNNNNNSNNNQVKTVYVTFDTQGGTFVAREILKAGEKASYRVTTKTGYRFLGWYLNGEKYDFDTPVKSNITLVAKWEKSTVSKHEVTFEPNNGNAATSKWVYDGESVSRPSDPSRKCYRFIGWYLNGVKYNFDRPVTGDIVLQARYEEDGSCNQKRETYTVSFNSKGGSSVRSQTVDAGDRAYKPSNPTKSGYRFLGWYDEYGYKYNFNARVYEDIILYARWEKDEVKYNTYCEVKNETYYSVSYVGANQSTWNYDWTIRFDKIRNTSNLKIVDVGYITTTNQYNSLYNKTSTNKDISMVGGNGQYSVPITSGSMLQKYALKYNNFGMSLSVPYYSGGYWYTKASVNIRNYNNVTSYYSSKINSSIYFVPFYFVVKYTDKNSCVDDLATNASKYKNYEIVDSYYN